MEMIDMGKVIVYQNGAILYPTEIPYNPSKNYAEFEEYKEGTKLSKSNEVYDSIRNMFVLSKSDIGNYGTEKWNPLGEFINKGDNVLLKPNLVFHETFELIGKRSLVTHSSLIRCIIDYAALALNGDGTITIADSPIQGADFNKIIEQNGLQQIADYCSKLWKIKINIIDLRTVWARIDEKNNQIREILKLKGDPGGYEIIDLKSESKLDEISGEKTKFAVSDYDIEVTNRNHNYGTHKYYISKSVLNADCIINLPKLKTHQKAGITCCMKNFVGIIGSKDYLAHHRKGKPQKGGDEYPDNNSKSKVFIAIKDILNKYSPNIIWSLVRKIGISIRKKAKDNQGISNLFLSSGGWHGNDTVWRMIYDLNYILFNNSMKRFGKSNILNIVDAVVCGEGNGPLSPEPKQLGMMIMGTDCLLTDAVCARVMGYDWKKIKFLSNYKDYKGGTSFDGTFKDQFVTNNAEIEECLLSEDKKFAFFKPPPGWENLLEKVME